MDMTFDNWDDLSVSPEDELKMLKRNLRNRLLKQILFSTLIVLSILFLGWKVLIPAAEQLYWDPTESTYLENIPDLELTMSVYTELFGQGQLLMPPEIKRIGFANYSIDAIFLEWETINELTDISYRSASIEKGQWLAEPNFWQENPRGVLYRHPDLTENDPRMFRKQQTIQKLKELPEYIQILATVTFSRDLSTEELLSFTAQYNWNGANVIWAAFRTGENDPACGIHLTEYQSSRYDPTFWQSTAYPSLFQERYNWSYLDMEAHIHSMLRFSADQVEAGTGIVPSWTDAGFYQRTLDYLEEHGVQICGCYLIATPDVLLELLESEDVSFIHLSDAWIGI